MDINPQTLPASRLSEDQYSDQPLDTVELGQLVAVYSRGATRVGQVTKLGPKNIQVAYTTEGAIASALKSSVRGTPEYIRSQITAWEERKAQDDSLGSQVDKYIANLTALLASVEALPVNERYWAFVNVTKKTVARTDVYGLKATLDSALR